MVRHRLLRDFFGALEGAAPVCRADTMDEYRELAMLAHAWERGSLEAGLVTEGLGRTEDEDTPAPARR